MADVRECAACGKQIQWVRSQGSVLPLDFNPSVPGPVKPGELEPVFYVIVDGLAMRTDYVCSTHAPMLSGPVYRNHVATCKPKKKT